MKATPDGVLGPTLLQALTAAADKARAEVNFKAVSDPKTGARIGAPTKLMGRPGGARLEFASSADADLAALYARLSAETPTRKVAYKAMKPGVFFVVLGQDGAAKFYSRFETSEGASPPVRGFTFSYPAAQASQFDRVAIAVAEFVRGVPRGSAGECAFDRAVCVSRRLACAGPNAFCDGAGHRIGPGADGADPRRLPNASIGGKPVRFERTDAATGLAILTGDFAAKGEPPRLGALKPDLVVLSAAGDGVATNSASLTGEAAQAARRRLARKRRERRSGVRSRGRPRRPCRADRGRAEADRRRCAGRAPSAHRRRCHRSFPRRGRADARTCAPLSAGEIAAHEKEAVVAVNCEK